MKAAGMVMGMISMVWLVAGLFPVFRPGLIRAKRRRHALAAWSLWFVLLATGIAFSMPTSEAIEFWVSLIVVWTLFLFAGWQMCRVLDIRNGVIPDPRDTPAYSKAMANWPRDPSPKRKSNSAPTPDALRIIEPAATPPLKRRDETPRAHPENDDFWSGLDDGEWGAILGRGMDGRPLSFQYANRRSDVSTRTVFEWVEYPRHFQGVCSEAGAVICFRKDRVIDWHAQSEKMLRAPKGKSRR